MATPSGHEISRLLRAWSEGDETALERLAPLVEGELRRLARCYLAGERPGHLLQTTALLDEVYVRLLGWRPVQWQNRAHFLGVAARMMRRVLVDYARKRPQTSRGEARIVPVDDALDVARERGADLIALDDALWALGEIDARKARIVELRYFGGLTVDETAEVVGVAPVTVMREWAKAKAWLFHELSRENGDAPAGMDRS